MRSIGASAGQGASGPTAGTRFEWCDLKSFAQRHEAAWRSLGRSAVLTNIYLMPEFVVPAAAYLLRDARPRVGVLWSDDQTLLVLGIFVDVAPSIRFPFPRLETFNTRHSFQSGLLVHTGAEAVHLEGFLGHVLGGRCAGLRINGLRADTRLFDRIRAAASGLGYHWFTDRAYQRATLPLTGENPLVEGVSKKRRKRHRRNRLDLERLGRVEFRVVTSGQIGRQNIDDFVRLESSGWKARSGLKGDPDNESFFRAFVTASAPHDQMFFCELLLDGRVIASTANFWVGESGFAFKVGYDPALAAFSPGLLIEFCYLEWCETHPTPYREMESGAMPGSFIEAYWPGRTTMVDGHLIAPGPARWVYGAKSQLRRWRASLSGESLRAGLLNRKER